MEWMLLPGCPGPWEMRQVLTVEEKFMGAGGCEKAAAQSCDWWQKFCPSPIVLVANKSPLETLFRLSRHVLKVLLSHVARTLRRIQDH